MRVKKNKKQRRETHALYISRSPTHPPTHLHEGWDLEDPLDGLADFLDPLSVGRGLIPHGDHVLTIAPPVPATATAANKKGEKQNEEKKRGGKNEKTKMKTKKRKDRKTED